MCDILGTDTSARREQVLSREKRHFLKLAKTRVCVAVCILERVGHCHIPEATLPSDH